MWKRRLPIPVLRCGIDDKRPIGIARIVGDGRIALYQGCGGGSAYQKNRIGNLPDAEAAGISCRRCL